MADSSSTSVTLGQNNDGAPDGTTIVTNGAGRIAVADPIVPVDGTQNITGALSVSGAGAFGGNVTSGAGSVFQATTGDTFYATANSTQLNVRGGAADSGTAIGVIINNNQALANAAAKLLSVQNNATEKMYVDLNGAIVFTGGAAPIASTVVVTQDGSSNMVQNVPSGKVIVARINGSNVTSTGSTGLSVTGTLSSSGNLTPGSGTSGASAIAWVGRGTYVIDFGAFTAGIDQTSAQALTGVAFGDCLSIGCSVDQSATIGQMTAMVSSAGNIVITVSPVSTTSTANPASATYTVTAIRTA